MDPVRHRTGDVWHVWVRGIASGQLYGYRIDGPYQPEEGHRFNAHKLLLDPFATAIAGVSDWNFAAARGYDSSSNLSRSVLFHCRQRRHHAEMHLHLRPFRLGRGPASEASRRRYGHLRNARSRLHDSSQFGCGLSRNLPRLDGKDPLSSRPGSHGHRVDARSGIQ